MPRDDRFSTTPDQFRLDDARWCGADEARVQASLVSGDWGWVDQLPEPDERKAA